MEKQGKFILFDDAGELASWLGDTTVKREIKLIQNHHTAGPTYKDFKGDDHFKWCTSMEAAHKARGFAEIAQNLTTFPDGKVALCRSFETDPAGIKGANVGAICIENLGWFDTGKDEMTDAQRETIVKVNAALCRKFELDANTDNIVYHHWFDLNSGARLDGKGITKSCPGTNFFGGNTVDDAQQNFLPLVAAELAGNGQAQDQTAAAEA